MPKSGKPTLHRDAWLKKALDVLFSQGIGNVKVETLARELDVTDSPFEVTHGEEREPRPGADDERQDEAARRGDEQPMLTRFFAGMGFTRRVCQHRVNGCVNACFGTAVQLC